MIERLLDAPALQRFFSDHYLRLPFAHTGGAAELIPLACWDSLEELLRHPSADTLIVRRGEQQGDTLPDADQARQLVHDGHTLVVRHAERHVAALGELAAGFENDFGGPVNIHLYFTGATEFGFGWHYDAEEVFIVQAQGSKEYSLRKNTVNPWPVEESLPHNMQFEREIMPLMRCRLQPGDWLYIPSGYWHMGRATSEAISLAIGVLPGTGIDVLDFVRRQALSSLCFRQRLPLPGLWHEMTEAQIANLYREVFQQLAAELSKEVTSEATLQQFIAQRRRIARHA